MAQETEVVRGLDEIELEESADPGRDAMRRLAKAGDRVEPETKAKVPDVSDQDEMDATAWLLASFREELPPKEHTLLIDVGTPAKAHKIKWRIRSITGPQIDEIREGAMGNRQQRRAGVSIVPSAQDRARAEQAQFRIIIAGTVDPDIRAVTLSTGLASPEEFLKDAFKYDSGLIDQIANAILALSAYDDELVQDEVEVGAAGN